ncbi:MAG: adenylate/guanylate cyclase domain-containing protein [Cyanobacteria bacterium P01_C01_bin.89]
MFLFRRPTSLVKVTAIATLMLFTPMVVSAVASYQAFNELVRNELRLQRLSDRVAYLDEVLTMSARMNAATGDQQWEERYQVHVTELDNTIAKSIQLSPESYDDRDAARTEAANEKLVAIEKEAFRLVRTGRSPEALALLLSAEYSQKKAQYSAGVEARQGAIQNHIQGKIENYRKQLILSGGVAGVTLLGLIPAWFLVLRALRRYLQELRITKDELRRSNDQLEIRVERRTQELRSERDRSEQLLLNILPPEIAAQLKVDYSPIADRFDEVTILFADIVGFTGIASSVAPLELVERLNRIFSTFDRLSRHYGLEKIKTIGDAYMVVGGLPTVRDDHADSVADVALAMQTEIAKLDTDPDNPLRIRIGINTGAVVAGVIGIHKFIYDLWGDAVNIASRMEASSSPGQIQVTESTYQRLKDRYTLKERGVVEVKGKGEMKTYWLLGKKWEEDVSPLAIAPESTSVS